MLEKHDKMFLPVTLTNEILAKKIQYKAMGFHFSLRKCQLCTQLMNIILKSVDESFIILRSIWNSSKLTYIGKFTFS